jgi:cytosine deaminase
MGENITLTGSEYYLKENGVKLINLDLEECKELMRKYIEMNPEVWDMELERVEF